VGGDINAYTAKEYTTYYCRVPARAADLGLELLGDVLTRPALRDTDVESERQVILDELAMDDDSPEDVAHRVFAEQVFGGHPLGRETAGERDSVRSITTDDVREFFARHYRTGSAVVAVAGAVDPDHVIERVADVFGSMPEGDGRLPPGGAGTYRSVGRGRRRHRAGAPRRRRALDRPDRPRSRGARRGEPRARRWPVEPPVRRDPRAARPCLLGVLVGRCVRRRRHVVGLRRHPARARRRGARTGRCRAIRRLVDDGITADELDIATGYLTGSYEMGLEDSGARMSRLGGLLCTRGDITPIGDQVARWLAVDQAAVRRVIDRVFRADPIVVRLGPTG
jgi:predicted Zn-dependent peptidase